MKRPLFPSLAILGMIAALSCSDAMATVTLQFSNTSAKLTNLANELGVVTDGMSWGVLIDTDGDGFDYVPTGTTYTEFANAVVPGLGIYLDMDGGIPTDDFLYIGSNLTSTVGGTDGGSGAATSISSVPMGVSGINAGDAFALIWFANNSGTEGSFYGVLEHASFVLPTDGVTQSYAAAFAGADPILTADQVFEASSVVPEPGSALYLLGATGLLLRRRRKSGAQV
jgi:hypothetical protein